MPKTCLNLICPPAIEEKLLDTLLEHAGHDPFTAVRVEHHGTDGMLSVADQVSGRSRALQVQLLLREGEMKPLVAMLREAFAGTGLRYWVTPVLAEGVFA